MPLGAFRLLTLANPGVVEEEEEQRTAVTTASALGDAQISSSESKFGGSSLKLDGTGDAVRFNDWGEFGTDDFTIEAWVYQSSNSHALNAIFTLRSDADWNEDYDGSDTYLPGLVLSAGALHYYNTTTNAVSANYSTALGTGSWQHIACVRNGTNLSVYIDGSSVLSKTIASDVSWTLDADNTESAIGVFDRVDYGGGGAPAGGRFFFDGYINDFRISSTARYTSSFTTNSTKFVDDSDTMVLFHFNGWSDSSNTDFYDDNGDRAPIVPHYVGGEIDTAQSKFGGSSFFTNSVYYPAQINVGTQNPEFDEITASSAFTIEFWARRGANTSGDEGLLWGNYEWDIVYDGSAETLEYRADGPTTTRITGGSLSVGTWYHIAVVRDTSNNTKMYIDGTQTGSTYTNDDRDWGNLSNIVIGGDGTFTDFHIDELRISNTQRYTSNFTAPTSAFTDDEFTLLLYHFDDSDAAKNIKDDNGMA